MNQRQRGFTLIELLVVVAIIGILSGIAFVSISGARESAYDTQIQSELSQIRSNAEQYYYDQGGTYGGNLEGVDGYYLSTGWAQIADQLPPCSVALIGENTGQHSGDHEGLDASQVYQISVGNQAYAAWAPLCAATEDDTDPVYYCIDSEGSSGEYQTFSDGTGTSCEEVFTNEL